MEEQVSTRPHEHYYLDQVDTRIWAVVCATCDEHVGLVNDPFGEYGQLAMPHWEEVMARGPRATT